MRLRLAAALAAALLFAAAPARADLLIQIDKSTQQMTVSADGELLYTWPVSTGRDGYDTPNGAFNPLWMDRDHRSEEWDDAPMPYSMFFTKQGHAIHGTYEARHLGQPVSHGCVRLSVKNASILWELVKQQRWPTPWWCSPARSPGGAGAARSRTRRRGSIRTSIRTTSSRPCRSGGLLTRGSCPAALLSPAQRPITTAAARPRGFFPFGW